MKDTYILAIETSCDETSIAIVKNGHEVVAITILTQMDTHAKFGGVVPEIASRMHTENITLVLEDTLNKAGMQVSDVDAIAVTYKPGLLGSLLVGIEFANDVATPVSFYVVNSGALQDNYILKSDLDAYRSTNGEDALPNGVESISDLHEDGWCYFNNIWVGQPQLGQSAEGPIERNTWYNLAITGITFPGDSEEKDPDPTPDPGEELPLEPLTNVALTITVPDWNFKSNSLVLGE